MLVGVPREIKNNEFRVGLVPAAVRELVDSGHQVLVETRAGLGIRYDDAADKPAAVTAIAYKPVIDKRGGLPLLAPMSEIAGRMSIQVGAVSLQKSYGGS